MTPGGQSALAQARAINAGSGWKNGRQLQVRRQLEASKANLRRDPSAKALAAWSSFALERFYGECIQGHGQMRGPLLPIYVDHDRAPHCERQLLLRIFNEIVVKRSGKNWPRST
eukprot:s2944_g14.t1